MAAAAVCRRGPAAANAAAAAAGGGGWRRGGLAGRRASTLPAFAANCEHPRGAELYFAPLGGCQEIGLNASLYYTEGQWLLVDLGNKMPSEHMTPGLELLVPDVSFLADRKESLAGLVITHGHEDHIGAGGGASRWGGSGGR